MEDLNPAQAELLDQLRTGDRPSFDPGLRAEIRAGLEDALADVVDMLPDGEDLWVSKYGLTRVHGCERNHVEEEALGFTWTVPAVRGRVVHKAVGLSVNWRGTPDPVVLVEEALAKLEDDPSAVGDFVAGLSEADRAELREHAVSTTTAFFEGWPPLKAGWRPVTDFSLRAELCNHRVILSGRPDLALGTPRGTEARRVIVDFKTGRARPQHRDDARFYALIDTLSLGVPPFRVGTYLLDAKELESEDVDLDVLEAAANRTVDGARKLAELAFTGREPSISPGPACGWCPVRDDCDGPARWAEESGVDPL